MTKGSSLFIKPKTSSNRAYLASANASAQIPLWGTSDTLGTLYATHYLNMGGKISWKE